jgi:hypothetical protein
MPSCRSSRIDELPFSPGPAEPGEQIRPEPVEELIDELIEMYVDWREECIRLRYAYGRWLSAPAEERDLAFGSYQSALDREEQVSVAYAKHIERIRSRALL